MTLPNTALVGHGPEPVRIAYVDDRPERASVLLLVHGSPGAAANFDALRDRLPDSLRVIAVDLPGFGGSTRVLDDYSFTRHAADLLDLLDALDLDRVHVLGMSMGGGVALEMARLAPGRVASLTLLSSIGMQDYEITGDYWTNHALHAAQVGLVWFIDHLVPHFGLLDTGGEAWSYARNFYDSDQRRLRPTLLRWEGPALILHGDQDFLVPVAAAEGSVAAMPQAELEIVEGEGHFMLWTEPALVARRVAAFVAAAGDSPGTLADRPRNGPATVPVSGPGRWILLGLAAAAAALAGPLAGWWFAGLVADGLVGAPVLLLALASGAGLSAILRRGTRRRRAAVSSGAAVAVHAGALLILTPWFQPRSWEGFVLAMVLWSTGSLAWHARDHAARRRLHGRWLRLSRWEYWPSVALYLPVVPRLLWRSRRYGGARTVTCVNPDMPIAGLVGESKSQILELLGDAVELPRWMLVDPGALSTRRRAVESFVETLDAPWPLVIKPDRGERGQGVTIARSEAERDAALLRIRIPLVVQEYAPGVEFGIFWYRRPGASQGKVFSIAAKEPVEIVGDGSRRLVDLLLDHDRVVPLIDLHLEKHATRLDEIPDAGERIAVTELGTHCLGATFLDASDLATPELEAALDRIMVRAPGLDFGRFDVRVPSSTDLCAGRRIRVIEFNGLSSEAVHMYDPSNPLSAAHRTLVEQWTLALEIGRDRRRDGTQPTGWADIARAWWKHRTESALRGGRR